MHLLLEENSLFLSPVRQRVYIGDGHVAVVHRKRFNTHLHAFKPRARRLYTVFIESPSRALESVESRRTSL